MEGSCGRANDSISIIVPVYRAEKYLPQCIDSMLSQTYRNLEIILVDDGSPDRCGEICDEYAKRDQRIRVIHQPNAGESAARNAGLDLATGAYVGFVDADDWIELDMYERMHECITREQTQIVACGWLLYEEITGREYVDRCYAPARFDGEEALYRLLKIAYFQGYMWNKLFDARLFGVNGAALRFDGRIHICQDLLLSYQAVETSGAIYYYPAPLYHYRVHTTSALGSFNERNLSVLLARSEMIRLAQGRGGRILELAEGLYSEAAANVRARAAAAGNGRLAKDLRPEAGKYAALLLRSREFGSRTKLVFLLRLFCPKLGYRLVRAYKKRFRVVWRPATGTPQGNSVGNN